MCLDYRWSFVLDNLLSFGFTLEKGIHESGKVKHPVVFAVCDLLFFDFPFFTLEFNDIVRSFSCLILQPKWDRLHDMFGWIESNIVFFLF